MCLLVSGLHFGGASFNPLATTLLSEFITGNLGSEKVRAADFCPFARILLFSCVFAGSQMQTVCGRISRVIVAGGLLDLPAESFSDKVSPALCRIGAAHSFVLYAHHVCVWPGAGGVTTSGSGGSPDVSRPLLVRGSRLHCTRVVSFRYAALHLYPCSAVVMN